MKKNKITQKEMFDKRYNDVMQHNRLNLSKSDLEVIRDYFPLLKSEGLSPQRRYKIFVQIGKFFSQFKDKDFLDLTKEDLIVIAGEIRDHEQYKESTKLDYLGNIKKIYKVLSTLPKYEEMLDPLYMWIYDKRNKFFSTNFDKRRYKTKKELFTEEEVMKIIGKANNIRDKLIFSMLATQGMRPGELFSIRRQDISLEDNEATIEVSGKTGVRPIYVQESYVLNYIREYLDSLPKEQEFLFTITQKRMNDVLKEICYDLGIKKRAILYQFRHFAITRDRIRRLSDGAMEQKYGWVKGSDRVKIYDKSSGKDYKREIREISGKAERTIVHSEFDKTMNYTFLTDSKIKDELEEVKKKLEKYDIVFEYLDKKGRLDMIP